MEYDNTNKGVLFKNDKDGGNPNWPDYKGSININGTEFWLSAWIKKSKEGKAFMSLSIGDAKQKQAAPQSKRTPAPKDGGLDMDNDVPF